MNVRFILMLLCLVTITTNGVRAQDMGQDNLIKKQSPSFALKSNLLYDATTTINLGAEIKTHPKWTLELPVNYNPWTLSDGKKLKHILFQPEMRYWFCESFYGHFVGVHAHGAYYNVAHLGSLFSDHMNEYRHQGWLVGAGVSYGYHWILSDRWSFEATIGVGYAYLKYDDYKCEECGQKYPDNTKNYFGPTKIGASIIYIIK